MIHIRSALPTAATLRRTSVLAVVLLFVAVACSNEDDDGTAAATEPEATAVTIATEAPEADSEPTDGDAASTPATIALDFGSGTGSITLGDETFEFTIGPGAGLCRDVFGIIQAGGSVAGDRDIDGEFQIPPLDWEAFADGRYDAPSVELEITSTGPDNASWIADARWAEENDKVGMSQVDTFVKEGQTASGTATFANAWDRDAESVEGSFEISCIEG